MRKRLVRAAVFIAVALGVAVGAAGAAGAVNFGGHPAATINGTMWD
jgi:hypothetical protein